MQSQFLCNDNEEYAMKPVIISLFSLLFVLPVGRALAAQVGMQPEMILIKGGTFMIGSPTTEPWREKDESQHHITATDFYIGKYEVTQLEYMGAMGVNPSNFIGDTLPVESVTWHDTVQYCNAKSVKEGLTPVYSIDGGTIRWNRNANGYRLLTEAEWEYACRAGTITPFNTENHISTTQANYYGTYQYLIETYYFFYKWIWRLLRANIVSGRSR
jgi:formylglycine-generating enzyme required for sulfatase activity